VKTFPKKWFIVSFIFHAALIAAFYHSTFESRPVQSRLELNVRHFVPEAETAQQPAEHPVEPQITGEISPVKKQIPRRVEKPVVHEPVFNLPHDFLLRKEITDSTTIIYAGIDSFFNDKIIVPNRLDITSVSTRKTAQEQPSHEDTVALLNAIIMKNIENVSLKPTLQDMTAEQISGEYYSKLNKTLPVDALIGLGAQLALKVIKKIFPHSAAPERVDRFLDFEEIEIMLVLWRLKSAVPSAVYRALPVDVRLTAADVLKILEQLKAKRLVFERDGKYEKMYIPAVSRQDFISFYNETLIILQSETGADGLNSQDQTRIDNVRKKLIILITGNNKL